MERAGGICREFSIAPKKELLTMMRMSEFGFASTKRIAAVAILASFLSSNVLAGAVRGTDHASKWSVSTATTKYTTDLTQLGREGRLRENANFEKETDRLIEMLAQGGVRQPVIIDHDEATIETIVEQLAIRTAKGNVPTGLAGKSIIKVDTALLFSNARTPAAVAQAVDSIVNDAIASKGKTILYIDELTSLVGASASATELFDSVAAGKLAIVGGSSAAAFDNEIKSQPEIAAYFAGILISESSSASAKNDLENEAEEVEFRGDNISPDLREMMANDPSGNTRLDVIMQAKNADNQMLRDLIASGQAHISSRIGNTDPLSALESLSQSGLINYVSPNRTIGSLGHIETTTGATQMRSQPASYGRSAAYTLDGTGVGIAVLDSGIYAAHRAFNDGTAGRLVYSQSFVPGDTSTDDAYGHGTHVASLAAGSHSRDSNAYRGIAYNAKIINLRVLDGGGSGKTADLLAAMDWVLANKATYNIRVANMSVGTPAIDTWTNDPLCRKAQSVRPVTTGKM